MYSKKFSTMAVYQRYSNMHRNVHKNVNGTVKIEKINMLYNKRVQWRKSTFLFGNVSGLFLVLCVFECCNMLNDHILLR